MDTNKIGIKTFLMSITAIVLIEAISALFISNVNRMAFLILVITRIFEIISIIVIVIIWGEGISSIGLTNEKYIHGIKRGLLWSAGFAAVILFLFTGLSVMGSNPLKFIEIRMPVNKKDVLLMFLTGGLIGPIAEEFFFRGIIFGFLRRWGMLIALLSSTFLFVIAHPSFSGIPIIQAIGGIIFALSYEIEGNLVVPTTIHILGNLSIFCLSF